MMDSATIRHLNYNTENIKFKSLIAIEYSEEHLQVTKSILRKNCFVNNNVFVHTLRSVKSWLEIHRNKLKQPTWIIQ